MPRQKVAPCLWFDQQGEEAARFYVSLFKDSRITNIVPGPMGTPMLVEFQLAGNDYQALNGGPHSKFNESISMSVDCQTQEEVDELWEKLSEGGKKGQCGWLKDKYGLSWQIVPSVLPQLLSDPDPARAQRALEAMLKMTKLNIQEMLDAADGAVGASSA